MSKIKMMRYIEQLNTLCWNSLFDTGYDTDDADLIGLGNEMGLIDSNKFAYSVKRRIAPRVFKKYRRIR